MLTFLSGLAWADAAHYCGTASYPDCTVLVSVLTVHRATIFPDGTAQQTIHLEFVDGKPGYTYGFQFELVAVGGPSSTPTVLSIAPETLEITAGSSGPEIGLGEGDVIATVYVPDSVDATKTAFHDGVYEMQATVSIVLAAAYPNDRPPVIVGSAFSYLPPTSLTGTSVPFALRHVNGDLCVIPNGEAAVKHGFIDDGSAYAFAGRWGGRFFSGGGTQTTADFTGRVLQES